MPPKRKDPSKKTSVARPPTLINGLTKEQLSKEQMREHIAHLGEELDRVREEKKVLQQQRDMYHTVRELTANRLEKVRAELKTMERAAEKDDVHFRAEKEVYQQKMKYLLCEHQSTVSELEDPLATADTLQKEQDELEDELSRDKKAIMGNILCSDYETQVKEVELKHQEEMAATRDKLERQHAEITAKYEEDLKLEQQEQELLTKIQLSELELQWESHIAGLTEDHTKIISDFIAKAEAEAEAEAKANLQLKLDAEATEKEIVKLKMEVKKMTQDVESVMQENVQITECLTAVKKEIAYLEWKNKIPQNPKIKALKKLKADHAKLEARFSELQLQRDELLESFEQTVLRRQHEADLPNILLERKIQTVRDRLEEVEAQLQSVASAPNMGHTDLTGLTNKVEGRKE